MSLLWIYFNIALYCVVIYILLIYLFSNKSHIKLCEIFLKLII